MPSVLRLANIQCTDREIAAVIGVSEETLASRCREDPDFASMIIAGREHGKASLRRIQWRMAQDGSVAMAIFLGKQMLGQRDRWDVENRQIGPNGEVISPGATFVISIER